MANLGMIAAAPARYDGEGASPLSLPRGLLKRALAAIRAWQVRAWEAQAIAAMDDHIRRDLGLPAAPQRVRFPVV